MTVPKRWLRSSSFHVLYETTDMPYHDPNTQTIIQPLTYCPKSYHHLECI